MEGTIDMAIDKDVLDQLLAGRDPQELFAKDGLLDELKKALSERMLSAELDDHLENEGAAGNNRRNGSSRKTMLTGPAHRCHQGKDARFPVTIRIAPPDSGSSGTHGQDAGPFHSRGRPRSLYRQPRRSQSSDCVVTAIGP